MISLENIFIGFIKSYRGFCLRYDPLYESMSRWTGAEIEWFAELGENLGFAAVVEKEVFKRHNPVDLAWIQPWTRNVILHLERENIPSKILETITQKLLPPDSVVARYCIAIFDELKESHFDEIQQYVSKAFHGCKECSEFLAICYGRLPRRTKAKNTGIPRYWMEWPVRGLHMTRRSSKPRWLEAKCTTDKNFMYTMYMVDPAPPKPDEKMRWGTKPGSN